MSRIDAWSGAAFPLGAWLDDHDLAYDTALIIADKIQSITVNRNGVELGAQNVRLEPVGGDARIMTEAGQVRKINMIIVGYKGHPTITNTDLKPGDRFAVSGLLYEVIAVMPALTDSLQAYAEAKG